MEHNKLERNLHYLKQKVTTRNPSEVEKHLLAKQQLSDLEQRDLEAVKIRAKARFAEEGEKSTRYLYLLEKKKQADKSIQTLTKENLDTITSTRDILIETRAFYKNSTPQKHLILTRSELSSIFLFLNSPPLNLKTLWKKWKTINHLALTA